MTTIIADITMSLDGYVTGPDANLEHGLGVDGESLHAWVESTHPVDRAILETQTAATGAVVMGRTLFDFVDGPHGWNDEMGYGADQVGRPPFFVVTSRQPDSVRLGLDFSFVLDGAAAAVSAARAAAGDRDVYVMGGSATIAGCLEAGVVDELRIHLSPEILGAGTPLFETVGRHRLVQQAVAVSPVATHLTYAVRR